MAMDINVEKKPEPGNLGGPVTSIDKPKTKPEKSSGKGLRVVIIIVLILAIVMVAGYLVDKYTSINLLGPNTGSKVLGVSANSDYQAIFLSNGQVYFGQIAESSEKNTVLKDIYYLQVSDPLQQVPPTETPQQPQLSLVKLGNELHGPEDKMTINNDHILFIERLKEDGKVVQAIIRYQEENE